VVKRNSDGYTHQEAEDKHVYDSEGTVRPSTSSTGTILSILAITYSILETICYWINPNVLYNGDRTKLKNTVVQPPKDKPFNGFGNSQTT
jgi:hypothetical protein